MKIAEYMIVKSVDIPARYAAFVLVELNWIRSMVFIILNIK